MKHLEQPVQDLVIERNGTRAERSKAAEWAVTYAIAGGRAAGLEPQLGEDRLHRPVHVRIAETIARLPERRAELRAFEGVPLPRALLERGVDAEDATRARPRDARRAPR